MNEQILEKFRTGKFQGGGGWDKECCDVCNNSSFLQEAMSISNPNQGYMLNLCDEHAENTRSAREKFKIDFDEQQSKSWAEYFWSKVDFPHLLATSLLGGRYLKKAY